MDVFLLALCVTTALFALLFSVIALVNKGRGHAKWVAAASGFLCVLSCTVFVLLPFAEQVQKARSALAEHVGGKLTDNLTLDSAEPEKTNAARFADLVQIEPTITEAEAPQEDTAVEEANMAAENPVSESPVESAQANASTGNYIASATSTKYHKPTCRFVDKIQDKNRIWFDTIESAEAAHYEPCGVCKP